MHPLCLGRGWARCPVTAKRRDEFGNLPCVDGGAHSLRALRGRPRFAGQGGPPRGRLGAGHCPLAPLRFCAPSRASALWWRGMRATWAYI